MNKLSKGLYYVTSGDVVNFTYILAVLVEAKLKGCNILEEPYLITYTKEGKNHSKDKVSDASHLNSIVDWLLRNYPDEYKIRDE